MNWATAFALTCAVELPFVTAIAPKGLRRRAGLDSLAANLLTHPLAWYLYAATPTPWLAIEIAVAVVEAWIYAGITCMPWRRAISASLLANSVTAAMSFLV
jgi:hypothetical protein